MSDTLITIKIGPVFFYDTWTCDCFEDFTQEDFERDVRNRKGRITVTLTERDLLELVSRAYHYADEPDYGTGLRSSARSTLKAIEKQWSGASTCRYFH